jgi:HSP20 family protein
MSTLARRDRGTAPARRFSMMDDVFDEWLRSLPMRRPFGLGWDWPGEDLIRVDEFREGSTEVVRAEMPGMDPAKDIDLTVHDGMLRIKAERRVDEKSEDKGYTRHEMRYGSLTRTLPLPKGVQEQDIAATYKDGILEIRIPIPEQPAEAKPTKIDIKA